MFSILTLAWLLAASWQADGLAAQHAPDTRRGAAHAGHPPIAGVLPPRHGAILEQGTTDGSSPELGRPLVGAAVGTLVGTAAGAALGYLIGPRDDVVDGCMFLCVPSGPAAGAAIGRVITSDGVHLYPLWQFTDNGVVAGLPEVLALFPEAAVDGWTLAAWVRTPDPELGVAPYEALLRGEEAHTMAVARMAALALTG